MSRRKSAYSQLGNVVLVVLLAMIVFIGAPAAWGTSGSDKVDIDEQLVAEKVIAQVNEERQARGLQPLEPSNNLSAIAEYHSTDMAEQGYYAHESPDGESHHDRLMEFPNRCVLRSPRHYAGSENIAKGALGNVFAGEKYWEIENETTLARALVHGWMDSYGHRQNILSEEWDRQGFGMAVNENGTVYATQMFCETS